MTTRTLPMFPLGRALLPNEAAPLRIFEPRYLTMMEMLRDERDPEFGVVLISRGWETGGGDDRHDVGTIAAVVQDVPLGETQRAVVGVGSTAFRVVQWLPDAPYPQAIVEDRPDAAWDPDRQRLNELLLSVRRLYALASELGADTAGQDLSLPDDPIAAMWRLASLTPLAEYDRQRLLELTAPAQRLDLLGELLADVTEELTLRLGSG